MYHLAPAPSNLISIYFLSLFAVSGRPRWRKKASASALLFAVVTMIIARPNTIALRFGKDGCMIFSYPIL